MVIKRASAVSTPALSKVVINIPLEVSQLAVRHEHIGVGGVALDAHAQNLNPFARVRPTLGAEAIEGQCGVGLSDELDLQAEPAPQPLLSLRSYGLLRGRLQREKLSLERIAVLGSLKHRNRGRAPA